MYGDVSCYLFDLFLFILLLLLLTYLHLIFIDSYRKLDAQYILCPDDFHF